jgi:hypothetical protein
MSKWLNVLIHFLLKQQFLTFKGAVIAVKELKLETCFLSSTSSQNQNGKGKERQIGLILFIDNFFMSCKYLSKIIYFVT